MTTATEPVVPAQGNAAIRRAAATATSPGPHAVAAPTVGTVQPEQGKPGPDAYTTGRPTLPGQRSAP